MKIAASGWILALPLLVAHAKCVLLAFHKEGGKPLAGAVAGALPAFASASRALGGLFHMWLVLEFALTAFSATT